MEFEKIKSIIAEVLGKDPQVITPESKFVDDLNADSLDVFQIIMEIENEFQITIEDSQIENIITVEDAVKEIHNSIK